MSSYVFKDRRAAGAPQPRHEPLDAVADGETLEGLFQAVLGRPVGNDLFKAASAGTASVRQWLRRLVDSDERALQTLAKLGASRPAPEFIKDADFRTPSLASRPLPKKALVVASCMAYGWKAAIEEAHPGVEIEHVVFNNASELEDLPASALEQVDFQITQIPLRSLVAEGEYYALPLTTEGRAQLERLFARALERLQRNLDAALKYNRQSGLTTFVLNFARPQANPLGRLAPKYDLANFSHFVYELNRALSERVAAERNVHLIDFDEIAGALGKRYILDDSTMHLNHGSFLASTAMEGELGLTPYGNFEAMYAPRLKEAALAVFHECLAAHRILSPSDKIKLVVFDLDGTLWRGVAAEAEEVGGQLNEGWPLGLLEAAAYLRKRGVLLALASKNDPEIAARLWGQVYGGVFPLENFVSVKFSWGPKTESLAEILRETNLLPGNALFVDDNPVERERARLAFPGLRVLEGPICDWRRMLLWADELQTPYITEEAAARSDSIRAVVAREAGRGQLSEAEYLESLAVRMQVARIDSAAAPTFKRAFELLNKTNQFNTTGRRWSEPEIAAFFASGGALLSARVADRHTDYGLTALALMRDGLCEQMVMSCRVFGLNVEHSLHEEMKSAAGGPVAFLWRATDKNGPARSFLSRLGLDADAGARETTRLDPKEALQPS